MSRKEPILINMGNRVRIVRMNRGLSQERLGELAKLHRTYIGMIERAEKNLTVVNLEKIAKALGVEPAELLK